MTDGGCDAEARGWPFPFADRHDGRLTRRQWGGLLVLFAGLHYLSLALAVWGGNFVPGPNHDHVHILRDILETGLPQHAIWPPGFGYYLVAQHLVTSALGWPYWTGKLLLDVWLVVASGAASTALGQALGRNRRLAVASGLGMVAAPIFLLASAKGLAVLLFQPLFLLSLLVLVKALQRPLERPMASLDMASLGLTAAAGALLGLACLVRANPQFLILALTPFVLMAVARRGARLLAWRSLLRSGALVLVFFAAQSLVTAPWQGWQRHLGKSGVFTAPVVFYAYVDGMARHPGNRVSDWVRAHRAELPPSFDAVVEINAKWIREDPGSLLRLYAIKTVRTWYLSDSGRWDGSIALLHAPWWLAALAGIGLWLRRSRGDPGDPALIFVLLVLLYMWGVSALVSGLARYLAPVYGLLGLAAGVAFEAVRRRVEEADRGGGVGHG